MLNEYYNKKVIILIDEYDTAIHEGYNNDKGQVKYLYLYNGGYYKEIIGFMRNFLSPALKDNINLEKAMLTGNLKIKVTPAQCFAGVSDQYKSQAFGCLLKESIFSGLNNLAVYTILNEGYSGKFGFTESETTELLKYYSLDGEIDEFKKWYNGYIFGSTTIYNPWSVLSYINEPKRYFMPYWVNTSENKIIKSLLAEGDEEIKLGLETLYKGGFIETIINEDIVMADLNSGNENLWSFLLLSGYLKVVDKSFNESSHLFVYKLEIPNIEIKTLYRSIIEKWFKEGFIATDFTNMLKALTIGYVELFEEYFSEYVMTSFSYFDISGKNPERV